MLIVGLVACGKSSERAKDAAPAAPPLATVPDAGAPVSDAGSSLADDIDKIDKLDVRAIMGGSGPTPEVRGQVLRSGVLVDVATLEFSAGGFRCREGQNWLQVYAGKGELLSIGVERDRVKPGRRIKLTGRERQGSVVEAILWPMNENPRKGTVTFHSTADAEFDLDFGKSGHLTGRVQVTSFGADRPCIIY